jgi:hypothetical protein
MALAQENRHFQAVGLLSAPSQQGSTGVLLYDFDLRSRGWMNNPFLEG